MITGKITVVGVQKKLRLSKGENDGGFRVMTRLLSRSLTKNFLNDVFYLKVIPCQKATSTPPKLFDMLM
jgi:hypothetical protein